MGEDLESFKVFKEALDACKVKQKSNILLDVITLNIMKKGYRDMGTLNLAFAEMDFGVEKSSLESYEGKMAKGEQ